jgi:hypothetical protein
MNREVVFVLVALLVGSVSGPAPAAGEEVQEQVRVSSSAFQEGGMIPSRYTCDGADVSPPLTWSQLPPAAESLALVCDDPDAPMGTWVHWVVYGLPATLGGLPENLPGHARLANGGVQGRNDFRKLGYGGPCPPSGTHRYYFRLYVLDTEVNLEPGATKHQLLKAIRGHILAEGELMGKYSR